MKKLILLLFLSLGLYAQEEPQFFSIGMLPEGYSFVCINGNKWLQYEVPGTLILEQLFYEDEDTGQIVAEKCNELTN